MINRIECRAVSRLLWEYATESLGELELERVERHLPRCARCREELEGYRLSAGLVARARQAPAPESRATWQQLRARLEAERAQAPVRRRAHAARQAFAFGGVAMAGALLALVVWVSNQAPPAGLLDPTGGKTLYPPPDATQPTRGELIGILPPKTEPRLSAPEFTPMAASWSDALPESIVLPGPSRARRPNKTARYVEPDPSLPEPTLEEDESPGAPRREFVMGSLDLQQANRSYVLGSIPAGPRITTASQTQSSEEAPVW